MLTNSEMFQNPRYNWGRRLNIRLELLSLSDGQKYVNDKTNVW